MKNDENHERWKDEAVAMYARRLQLTQPELALGLTEKIVEEDLRIATQVIIAKTWKVKDSAEAEAWIENESGMTPPEKDRAQAVTVRQRQGIVASLERAAGLTESAAKERLEDWSDPGSEQTPRKKTEQLRHENSSVQQFRR